MWRRRPSEPARRRTARPGLSLVELVVVLFILGIVLGALVGVTVAMQRQLRSQVQRTEASDALLIGENFITQLLRSAEANPFGRGTLLRFDPITSSCTFQVDWGAGNVTACSEVRVYSDFNPPDGDQLDPFETARLFVRGDTLLVNWRIQAGGDTVNNFVATPIRSLRLSYYSTRGAALNPTIALPETKQVRFRLEAPLVDRGVTTLTRRDRWVYVRNP